jgi:hypothetical protein
LGLIAAPAWANLFSAQATFDKKDFASAFQQFKELAELRQPLAHYQIGTGLMMGHGCQCDTSKGGR